MTKPGVLLDCTRLVSRSWTKRSATGIDRVCQAYLRHFASRARAVVQHRGVFRTLTRDHSDRLFDLLEGPDEAFRSRMMTFAPVAIARGDRAAGAAGAFYINVGHTDFDLDSHGRWAQLSRLRPIYLLHDLIPLTHPDYCEPHAVRRHRGRVIGALKTANGIIVNSRSTQKELGIFAADQGLALPPVLAAQIAGASLVTGAMSESKTALSQPYFVCVGTIEQRKNHTMLLRLWKGLAARLGARTPRLVIIGQWGKRADALREMLRANPALAAHVTILNRCNDADLGAWVAGARALLMPSVAEGFGLPVDEALKLGTPVIASDLDCFREIGQGIPLLLPSDDSVAWEDAIVGFATVSPERDRQLRMMRSFRPSTWTDHFADVETWMERLPTPGITTPHAIAPRDLALAVRPVRPPMPGLADPAAASSSHFVQPGQYLRGAIPGDVNQQQEKHIQRA